MGESSNCQRLIGLMPLKLSHSRSYETRTHISLAMRLVRRYCPRRKFGFDGHLMSLVGRGLLAWSSLVIHHFGMALQCRVESTLVRSSCRDSIKFTRKWPWKLLTGEWLKFQDTKRFCQLLASSRCHLPVRQHPDTGTVCGNKLLRSLQFGRAFGMRR